MPSALPKALSWATGVAVTSYFIGFPFNVNFIVFIFISMKYSNVSLDGEAAWLGSSIPPSKDESLDIIWPLASYPINLIPNTYKKRRALFGTAVPDFELVDFCFACFPIIFAAFLKLVPKENPNGSMISNVIVCSCAAAPEPFGLMLLIIFKLSMI